jgi:protein TonB
MVGVVNRYKEAGLGSPAKVPPKEIVKQKEPTKPKKKVVKNAVKTKREKVREKKEVISRDEGAENEELTVASNQSGEIEKTIELPTAVGAGTEGFSKGVEMGYPDYKVNPKPNYPMIARRNGYEGVVFLNVFVLESGRVGRVQLEKSSGYAMLDKSAVEAVRDWIFVPGKRNGVPFASWVTVPIRFQLSSG